MSDEQPLNKLLQVARTAQQAQERATQAAKDVAAQVAAQPVKHEH